MKFLLRLLGGAILVFLVLQLVPYGRAHSNPPVVAEPKWDSLQTKELFTRACADCHSNETVWPWYSNIAPVSWLVQKDVDEGRAKLNVSRWGNGEQDADDVQEVIQDGSMPPGVYLITHPEARLSQGDADALIKGLVASFALAAKEEGFQPSGDGTRGDASSPQNSSDHSESDIETSNDEDID